ncbi:fimbrial protein (plasmid) [Serratia marcescens]|nr:fimbrial protein [Serratia marcescens]
MKSSLLFLRVTVTALATGLALTSAHAESQNTIRFQGEVNAQTCNVDVNGASGSPVVLLPTVSTGQLNTAKSTAGKTSFTINVSGCQAPTSDKQSINVVLAGNNISTNGNLGNTGTAKNVDLQLLDESGKAIDLSSGEAKISGMQLEHGATSASQDFSVQYYTDIGNVSAGSVLGSVQYAISYP